MTNEYLTRLGRVEAENEWKPGDGDIVNQTVRRNLSLDDPPCHTDTWITVCFVAVTVLASVAMMILR